MPLFGRKSRTAPDTRTAAPVVPPPTEPMPALNGPACAGCSLPNPFGARYCIGCGAPLAARRAPAG